MADVSIAEAKAKLSEIVATVEAGEMHVITRRGKAVAKLVPLDDADKLGSGQLNVDALRAHLQRLRSQGEPLVSTEASLKTWRYGDNG